MHMAMVLWIIIFVFIALSAAFSSSETALSSMNRIRLKYQMRHGNKRANRVLWLYERYHSTLTGILIGNNIVNIAASTIGTVLFTYYFGAAGAGIATLVLTVLILVFAEVMPKTYAKEHANQTILFFSFFLKCIVFILTPIIWLFDQLQKLMEHFSKAEKTPSLTEQELKVMIEEIESEGVLEGNESKLVRSALDFDETTVEQAMTPRVDIIGIDVNTDKEEMKEKFFKYHYSRMPVFDKTIDQIIGVIYEKDFFKAYLQGGSFTAYDLLQKPLFVPSSLKISEMLKKIQALKAHMAVVIDQYGGVEGIITLEDVVEELVGDIYGEFEVVQQHIQKIGDHAYRVNADISMEEMCEAIGILQLRHAQESNTVGGFILNHLGKVPKAGETFQIENLKITVKQMRRKRICWIIAEVIANGVEDKET